MKRPAKFPLLPLSSSKARCASLPGSPGCGLPCSELLRLTGVSGGSLAAGSTCRGSTRFAGIGTVGGDTCSANLVAEVSQGRSLHLSGWQAASVCNCSGRSWGQF